MTFLELDVQNEWEENTQNSTAKKTKNEMLANERPGGQGHAVTETYGLKLLEKQRKLCSIYIIVSESHRSELHLV